jgi:hypothetical protein
LVLNRPEIPQAKSKRGPLALRSGIRRRGDAISMEFDAAWDLVKI